MEQAVLICIKLSDDGWGSEADEDQIFKIDKELRELFKNNEVGLYDGHEFGGGFSTLYLFGPDAEMLYQFIKPHLKKIFFPKKSFIIKRFGGPDAPYEKINPNALLN